MNVLDKIKEKLRVGKGNTQLEITDCYPVESVEYPENNLSLETRCIQNITQLSQAAESFGNFLNKTNAELQTNLAAIDANLKKDLSKIESDVTIALKKEENTHQQKMANRQLIQEVIEMTRNTGSPEVAMRILDSIDNIVNKEADKNA